MEELRRARPLLGTLVEIHARGASRTLLERAVVNAFARIERIHARMSFHDSRSELSRINRHAQRAPVPVSIDTWRVLSAASRLSARSGGVFDVSVGARLVQCGYLPGDHSAARGADYRDVVLLPHRCISFMRPLCIDLGGIAKGYAVDVAVAALKSAGVTSGCVNAGGDLRVFGAQTHAVHIRHPQTPTALLPLLDLHDRAIATTAAYFTDGIDTAVVDPRSDSHWRGAQSVSVVCRHAMYADALTKVVALLGEAAQPILQRYRAQAFVLDGAPNFPTAINDAQRQQRA